MSTSSGSASTGTRVPILEENYWLETLAKLLHDADLRYALIGGQAVNAWVLPRTTDDYDFVVEGRRAPIDAFLRSLQEIGLTNARHQDAGGWSGPDFAQYRDTTRTFQVDVQVSKTEYQDTILRRAIPAPLYDARIATPEDLVVLKLLAMRSKDQRDIAVLMERVDLDRDYIEHWAGVLSVVPRWKAFVVSENPD